MKPRVCVVGLGKLGACLAAVVADAGHWVVGLDTNQRVVDQINKGVAPVDEPGLQDLIAKPLHHPLVATTDTDVAVVNSDIAFIVVPTPSRQDGSFDDSFVRNAVLTLGDSLAAVGSRRPYTIVVSSTVMPGTCAELQRELDDVAGRHVPLLYSPEFIALGTVIRDMRNPDLVLIGTDSTEDAAPLIAVMSAVAPMKLPPWCVMSHTEAELAKIAVNSYVTMKISFANQLAAICEGLPGVDANIIAGAIGHDRRIGSRYLQPGGPYGGPCFPRDNRAFQRAALRAGADAPLAEATDIVNGDVIARIVSMIPEGSLAILGMTYKTGTSVREESLGSQLAYVFRDANCHESPDSELDAQALIDKHDHVIVTTPCPEYAALDYANNDVVIDVWGILPVADNVRRLGVGE